jgi:tetratricopeptide (TPR) repeat protein
MEDSMEKQLKSKQQKAKIIPFIQNGEYYFKKGMQAYQQRDLYKAKKYFERAVQYDKNDATFVLQLASVLAELGEYQASNQWLFKIVHELDETMYECFYFLANNFAHLGLFREAMKYAEMYLACDPNGHFAEDTEDLIELLKIDQEDENSDVQDDLIVLQERARFLLEKEEFPEAIRLLETIIANYPEFWSAYNNLALAYFYNGNVQKAQEIVEQVLERNPGNLHALCNLLVFYYYLRNEQQVKRLSDKLACVYPFFIEHRYKLGATFALVGRFDLAFKWLYHLYKMGYDGDDAFYYWLTYAAYYTGREELAKNVWEKVIKVNPDKRGEEPWTFSSLSVDHELRSIIRWFNQTNIAEMLYGLYLLSQSPYKNDPALSIAIRRYLTDHPLLSQFADYFLFHMTETSPSYVINSHIIINELSMKNDQIDENMYISWFSVVVNALPTKERFSNHSAWAAAMEYVWRQQQGQRVTQKWIADKYHVSLSTVKKYVKKVKELLS